jgi:molecular chaperone DnaK
MEGGEPTVITNSEGGRTTPQSSPFAKDGNRLVGQVAKRQAVTTRRTPSIDQAFHGRRFDEVDEEISRCPIRSVGRQRRARARAARSVAARNLRHDPAESSSRRRRLPRQKVDKAVITVPAYFNDAQRQATRTQARWPVSK